MFCIKCGEVIPDESVICPVCGVNLQEESGQQSIVYASPKEDTIGEIAEIKLIDNKKFYIWCVFAILSFVFLAFNYLSVNIKVWYISSGSKFTGYGLLECLRGTVRLSGYMVILLIVTNVVVFITGIIGAKGNVLKAKMLKVIMLAESFAYLVVTIVPYFNIKKVLAEFDANYATTKIGAGCYLNIVLAIIVVIFYFINFHKHLDEK